MRTTPEDVVAEPYEATAMKSISLSIVSWRARSDRKNTAPLRIPSNSTFLPS